MLLCCKVEGWRGGGDLHNDSACDYLSLFLSCFSFSDPPLMMIVSSGVLPERFLEAKTVKHCALSLVGEPIMYPRINEMVKNLHERGISSFLVGNGQFPDEIRNMEPVTQLYVSVDAATSESMKAVDRPLFKDFWARFKVKHDLFLCIIVM